MLYFGTQSVLKFSLNQMNGKVLRPNPYWPLCSALPTELTGHGLYPVQAGIFSSLIFSTAQEVFITAKIAFIFTSLSTVPIYDFHIFTVIYSSLHGFMWNQHIDQLAVGLLAELVERCTGIAEVMSSNPVQAYTGLL